MWALKVWIGKINRVEGRHHQASTRRSTFCCVAWPGDAGMGCSQVACAIEGWWTGRDHHHRKLLSLPHVIIIYDLCLKKGRVHFTSNHQQSLCNRAATPAPNVRVRHYSEQLGAVSAARSLIKSDLRVARLASARGVLFVFFHFISSDQV
jgi:hypothetical protein